VVFEGRPKVTPAKTTLEFTPMAGLLGIARNLAESFGLSSIWEGENNLEGVVRDKLAQLGIPQQPIQLLQAGGPGLTPRQMAERAGIIGRRHRRRVK
jgi:hypothetical protein